MKKNVPFLLFLFLIVAKGYGQDFMMQGWYWDYPKPDCYLPGSTSPYTGPSLAEEMALKAEEQAAAGFTMMWMPPLIKASFGDCSNGYDPKDLYDYGQDGISTGRTGLGSGNEVDLWIDALHQNNIYPIADVVYNHRDGGEWEDNPAVNDYIFYYPNGGGCGGFPATPYPVNGKVRYLLPLGGNSGHYVGNYYIKFKSASNNEGFAGKNYKLYFQTSMVGFQNLPPINEIEPNGGGECGQLFQEISLGVDILAIVDDNTVCNIDEFSFYLDSEHFNQDGDFLEIYIEEIGGSGTGIDIRPEGIFTTTASGDRIGDLVLQTRTDFTDMPSGLGPMNYLNFKPNGLNSTCMTGDLDFPYFFFDVEQAYITTGIEYDVWNKWLWNAVGIRGYRIDAVKHFPAWFVGILLNELHQADINPPLIVGEHFTSDAVVLKTWVDDVESSMTNAAREAINVRAFDFELRDHLRAACETFGFDVRNVFQSGMADRAGANGTNVVTFVNNHDFRYQDVYHETDPMLAYAYILTNNKIGLPSVYYPDYYGGTIYLDDGGTLTIPSYQEEIDLLMSIHKEFIFGSPFVDYLTRFNTPYASNYIQGFSNTSLIYQIKDAPSGKDVVVAINFAGIPLEVNQTINTAGLPSGETFYDHTGNAVYGQPTIETAGGIENSLYIHLPARSYAVFVNEINLAVDWISFNALNVGSQNEISWEAGNLSQIERFEVQKSNDGKNFTTIYKIASDEFNAQSKFRFFDKQPGQFDYYRIKGIEFNGEISYTKVVSVKRTHTVNSIRVSPNPASRGQKIAIHREDFIFDDEILSMKIMDINGNTIRELNKAERSIATDQYPAGNYLLQVITRSQILNKVIILTD